MPPVVAELGDGAVERDREINRPTEWFSESLENVLSVSQRRDARHFFEDQVPIRFVLSERVGDTGRSRHLINRVRTMSSSNDMPFAHAPDRE